MDAKNIHETGKINKKVKPLSYEEMPLAWKRIFFKTYPRFPKIKLTKIAPRTDLENLLLKRDSFREYKDKGITLHQLSGLLRFGVGMKQDNYSNWDESRRTYPSGGARYPCELYIAVLKSADKKLPEGMYHYNFKQNALEVFKIKNLKSNIKNLTLHDFINDSSALILISSVFSRTTVKYGNRGYRFALIEAGHIGQNIYLLAQEQNLGCCAIGGFLDDNMNSWLDLPEDEQIISGLTIGFKKNIKQFYKLPSSVTYDPLQLKIAKKKNGKQ